jgi:AhpD family alkylhydroperoxidase
MSSTSRHFPNLNAETAPAAARPALADTVKQFGFLPAPVARQAASPLMLEAFHALHGTFERATLSPTEREALVLVVARSYGCDLCRAMHRHILTQVGAAPELVAALHDGTPVADARLAALVQFVEATLRARGDVTDEELDAFVAAGFTAEQALEVVVGIGTYTLSTFANRMTRSHALR